MVAIHKGIFRPSVDVRKGQINSSRRLGKRNAEEWEGQILFRSLVRQASGAIAVGNRLHGEEQVFKRCAVLDLGFSAGKSWIASTVTELINMSNQITLECSRRLVITSLVEAKHREELEQSFCFDEGRETTSDVEKLARSKEGFVSVENLGEEYQGEELSIPEDESNAGADSSGLEGSIPALEGSSSDLYDYHRSNWFGSERKQAHINDLRASIPFIPRPYGIGDFWAGHDEWLDSSDIDSYETTGLAIFDIPKEAESIPEFLRLFLMKGASSNYVALLLETVSTKAGPYRRIGIIESERLLEGATSQQMTII